MNISTVIPVINEESFIQRAVASAWAAGANEVIVVDGGSSDRTLELAAQANCVLLKSEAGRARQQNIGAQYATGDVLLFLHVDTVLAEDGCNQIRTCFSEQAKTDFGVFRQRIDSRRWVYRWIERGNLLRVQWQNLAYGDQGVFIRRELFEELGGFPSVPLMEDYIFSQTLRKRGQFAILDGPLLVNARRWEKFGPVRQTIRNWVISIRFRLGASPEALASSYRRHDK